jgi:type IX secretion system PorP/SprF family membrane protein
MKARFTYSAIIVWLTCLSVNGQHSSDYVQYMFNGLLLNPAYAGSHEALNVTGIYRRQWIGIPGAPATMAFTGHAAMKNRRYNAGFVIENEAVGLYRHTRADAAFAYRFPFLGGKLSFGLQAGLSAFSYNWSRVVTTQSDDPSFTSLPTRYFLPDAAAGAYYYRRKFYLGISSLQLFVPGRLTGNSYLATTGCLIPINEDFQLKPVALVKYIQGSPLYVNVSSTFYYREVVGAGAGVTPGSNVLFYLDVKLTDQLNAGYGFQRQLNRLNTYTSGSHEIMLRYLFRYRIKAASARYF